MGGIDKDFILSNSYRNPRITLRLAHGLGLGIYRLQGIVDILPDRRSWNALGYTVLEPSTEVFDQGDRVSIERLEANSKNILERLLKEKGRTDKELISVSSYSDAEKEYKAVVNKIEEVIYNEKISPEQIIVISLATSGTKEIFSTIRSMLDNVDVKAITPGYIENAVMFQEKGFVILATPYRAKGNEAVIRQTLTPEERQQVVEHVSKNYPNFHRFLQIFFHSGTRISELLRLKTEDVDLKNQRFKVALIKGRRRLEVWKTFKDLALPYWKELKPKAEIIFFRRS